MSATVHFRGGREIERALEGLGEPSQLRRIATAALRKAAKPMVERAQLLAPKDEYHLERAIKVGATVAKSNITRRNPTEARTFIGIDGRSAPAEEMLYMYASLQEFGRKDDQARPYMRPALAQEGPAVIDKAGEEMWAGIEARTKRLARGAR